MRFSFTHKTNSHYIRYSFNFDQVGSMYLKIFPVQVNMIMENSIRLKLKITV